MKARRTGKCPCCKEPIAVGDEIVKSRGRWVLEACARKAGPVVAPKPEEVTVAKATVDRINGMMLGRGAPTTYDDLGYNKIDHSPCLRWLDGDPWREKTVGWTKMVDRLYKYRRQIRSLGEWDAYGEAKDVIERWAETEEARAWAQQRNGRGGSPQPSPAGSPASPQATQRLSGGPSGTSGATSGPEAQQGPPGGRRKTGEKTVDTGAGALAPQMRPRPALVSASEPEWLGIPFAYDRDLVAEVKALPRRRWLKEDRMWAVPYEAGLEAAQLFEATGEPEHLALAEAIRAFPGVIEAGEKHSAALGLGRAASADAAGEAGAKVVAQVEDVLDPLLPSGLKLYPFQSVGVGFIHAAGGEAIIADEMGCGKTIEALAFLLHEKQQGRDPFPAVIVVPATLKLNWEREALRWLSKLDVKTQVIYSNTPASDDADVIIINYELMRKRVKVEDAKDGRRKVQRVKDVFGLPEKPGTVIVDECHRIKNPKAQQTRATLNYAKLAPNKLLLSGTPMLNRPVELWPALSLMRPTEFGSFWGYAKRYCGACKSRWGWDFGDATNLDELRNRMRPFMLRRTKDQVLSELPPKRRATVTWELSNRKAYDKAEAELLAWLSDTTRMEVLFQRLSDGVEEGKAKEEADRAARNKAAAAERAEHLVRMNTLRRLAGEGKVVAALDWTRDFVAAGKKLVIFAHHKKVIGDMAEALRADDIGCVTLTGDTPTAKRQGLIDAFQRDDSVMVFLATTTAGGVGITLTAANDVLFIEREWVPGDEEQAEDRCHRIGATGASVTCWYAESPNCVDHDLAALVEEKRAVFQDLIDGRKTKSRVMADLTKRLVMRGARSNSVLEDWIDRLESAGAFDADELEALKREGLDEAEEVRIATCEAEERRQYMGDDA